jgi:hypothetical protein
MKRSILLFCLLIQTAFIYAQSLSISNIAVVGKTVTFTILLTPSTPIYLGLVGIELNYGGTTNTVTSAVKLAGTISLPNGNSPTTNVTVFPGISSNGQIITINARIFDDTDPVSFNSEIPKITSQVSLGSYSVTFQNNFTSTVNGTISIVCASSSSTAVYSYDPTPPSPPMTPAYPQNKLAISCIGSGSLPLELLAFTAATNAKSNKTTAQLSWLTAREVNLQGYEVERSGDGKTYEKIGSVKPTGSASSTEKYAFTDDVPLSGTNYYRLKMVNTEGSFTYSAVRSVLLSDGKTDKVSVSPNPAKDRVVVKLNALEAKNVTLTLVDVAGKTVFTDVKSLETGFNEFSLNVAKLPQGLYFLKVADGKTSEMHRLVIGN